MSGRKYSKVDLQNNVREAIRCRLAAEDALARAESLYNVLSDAARATESLRPAARVARDSLEQIREELKSLSSNFQESRLMRLDLSEVRRRRKKVDDLREGLEAISRQCREGQSAAGLRAEIQRVADELDRRSEALEPWLRDVYEEYRAQTRDLLRRADEEMRATGSTGTLARQVPAHTARYQGMLDRVEDRRNKDAERRYIADALQRICISELGFSAKILPPEGPLDDLVVEVDTFAFGILRFRLELGGDIHSRSDADVSACPANFKQIEENLKSLGVISNFRYEGDQSPVVIRDEAKPLPNDDLLVSRERG
jgi:hypothetical protein